jgi:hypothetical protein
MIMITRAATGASRLQFFRTKSLEPVLDDDSGVLRALAFSVSGEWIVMCFSHHS